MKGIVYSCLVHSNQQKFMVLFLSMAIKKSFGIKEKEIVRIGDFDLF